MAQKTGLGTTLVFADTPLYLPKKASISGPSQSVEALDFSHLESPAGYKEFNPDDLIDGGELQVETFWDPDDGYPPIGLKQLVTLTHNNIGAATEAFPGFITGFDRSISVGALMMCPLTVKVAGAITFSP